MNRRGRASAVPGHTTLDRITILEVWSTRVDVGGCQDGTRFLIKRFDNRITNRRKLQPDMNRSNPTGQQNPNERTFLQQTAPSSNDIMNKQFSKQSWHCEMCPYGYLRTEDYILVFSTTYLCMYLQ